MQVLNSTAIASGYAGRDLQRGISDGNFFSKFFFLGYKERLKIFFQFFKRKEKKYKLQLMLKEGGRLRRWRK